MFEQYGRSAATKVLVLVSDNGGTSQPPEALTANIAAITNDGIHIFAIGGSTVLFWSADRWQQFLVLLCLSDEVELVDRMLDKGVTIVVWVYEIVRRVSASVTY